MSDGRIGRRRAIRWLATAALAVAAADVVALVRWPRRPSLDIRHAPVPTPQIPAAPVDAPTQPRAPERPGDRGTRTVPAEGEGDTEPGREAATVPLACRGAWQARPPSRPLPSHAPAVLTVHHTGVLVRSAEGAPARLRAYQDHHLDAGFADLAYHFVVDRSGRVFEGRPVTAPGESFTDYDPTGHVLPCLEGNFDEQRPTPAQVDRLVDLLAWAAATFAISPATISGHREHAATRCPGDHLQALVDDGSLRARVERRLSAGPPRLDDCAP